MLGTSEIEQLQISLNARGTEEAVGDVVNKWLRGYPDEANTILKLAEARKEAIADTFSTETT